jgi:hypothetical protein
MALNFDFAKVKVTEFGIGRDTNTGSDYRLVPVDQGVQSALTEMAEATWLAAHNLTADPPRYEPSEKYGSTEYVYLPLDDELATTLRNLHQANNLPMDAGALRDPDGVSIYFARLADKSGRRLTALKRAAQFKGALKGQFVRFLSDALRLVEDRLFRLDAEFDVLIDSERVHVLRPAGFEALADMNETLLSVLPKHVAALERDMPFVDFAPILGFASKHPRAARYLASIHAQGETASIDSQRLITQCALNEVEICRANGVIKVGERNIMGFLEVLDRRRFSVELVTGSPERYTAPSRRRLDGGGKA